MAVVPRGARLDLAHVVRRRDALPLLKQMESFDASQGWATALKALAGSRPLRKFHTTTLLGNGQYYVSQFETPAVPAEERADALRWRFKDMVDFAVDSASIGVLDIPTDAASGRQAMVYAVAAGMPVVGEVMKSFDDAKVPLEAIDVPELAQRNVAALFEQENRGLAFLCLDEEGGLLTVTYGGELYAVRRIDVSAAQISAADPDRRTALLERVMLELQRTLDNFDRQYSFISVAALMVAACPTIDDLLPYLSENLYVPVRQAELETVLDLSATPELIGNAPLQARYLPAIGAALRSGAGA